MVTDDLKMAGIHTAAIATKVIRLKTGGDRPDELFIREAMCVSAAPDYAWLEQSVALR